MDTVLLGRAPVPRVAIDPDQRSDFFQVERNWQRSAGSVEGLQLYLKYNAPIVPWDNYRAIEVVICSCRAPSIFCPPPNRRRIPSHVPGVPPRRGHPAVIGWMSRTSVIEAWR